MPSPLGEDDDGDNWRPGDSDHLSAAYTYLTYFLDTLQCSGLLFGRVEVLKLRYGGEIDEEEWEITDHGNTTNTATHEEVRVNELRTEMISWGMINVDLDCWVLLRIAESARK